MVLVQSLEAGISLIVPLLKLVLEMTSLLCILIGFVSTIKLGVRRWHPRSQPFPFSSLRISFGQWLVLALEFQLGADIVATTIAPSFETLTKLAMIAVIRTFLNYFLAKELKEIVNPKSQE